MMFMQGMSQFHLVHINKEGAMMVCIWLSQFRRCPWNLLSKSQGCIAKKCLKIEKLQKHSKHHITHICTMKIRTQNKYCRPSYERTSYVQILETMDKICWFQNGNIWNYLSWLLISEVATTWWTHTHTHRLCWPSCGGYCMYAYVFFIQYWVIVLVTLQVLYTVSPRRNVPDFRRVFLMLKYTDITQNTHIQSWMVTEIVAREKCGLLAVPRTAPFQLTPYMYTAHVFQTGMQSTLCLRAHVKCLEP